MTEADNSEPVTTEPVTTEAEHVPQSHAPTTGDDDLDVRLAQFDSSLEDESDLQAHIEAGHGLLAELQRRLDDLGGS